MSGITEEPATESVGDKRSELEGRDVGWAGLNGEIGVISVGVMGVIGEEIQPGGEERGGKETIGDSEDKDGVGAVLANGKTDS